jgi:hypothetical protein
MGRRGNPLESSRHFTPTVTLQAVWAADLAHHLAPHAFIAHFLRIMAARSSHLDTLVTIESIRFYFVKITLRHNSMLPLRATPRTILK